MAATSGAAVVESLAYDALNRMGTSQVAGMVQKVDGYDGNGNVTSGLMLTRAYGWASYTRR